MSPTAIEPVADNGPNATPQKPVAGVNGNGKAAQQEPSHDDVDAEGEDDGDDDAVAEGAGTSEYISCIS
jgi:hypothetical protein